MDDDRFATSSQPRQRRIRIRAALATAFLVVGLLAPTSVVQAAGIAQSITFDAAPTGVTVGATGKAVSATATSLLPVTYSSATTGICDVDGSTGALTLHAAGTCRIHADQAGDGTFDAAPQATQDVTVGLNGQTISFDLSGLSAKTYGDVPFGVTATATSGLPVTFSTDTTTVCTVTAGGAVTIAAAGTCTIHADQAGDGTYDAAPRVDQSVTVAKATPGISVIGGSVAYDGSPHGGSGFAYGVGGTGDVLAPAVTLAYAGTGGTTYGPTASPPTAVGTFLVTATFAGNSNYLAGSGSAALTIATGGQAITFGALADRTYGDSAFAASATASSGLAVTFSTSTTAVCTVTTGGSVTIVGAGSCTIQADQAGDSTYAAAPPVSRTFSVGKATLTITADPRTKTYGSADPSFTFAYGTFVGADTSAVIDTPPTCSVSGLHADVGGSPYPITCSGGLDNNYTFAYVGSALTVGKATPTVNLAASVATFEAKVPVTFTASLPAVGAGATPTGSVTFTITGVADQAVVLSAGAAASSALSFTTTGAKSAVASYAGDANYASAQATLPFTVVANTVNATGVGLSSSAVFPVRDGWRDTVAVRGMRNEPISVAIRVYGPTGRLVRTASWARASGAYSWAWNGRTASGALLAAGRYRVDQTLVDAYGAAKLFRSYVTVSRQTMHWRSATIYASPGPRHWQYSWGYPSSTISGASSATSSALTMVSSWLPSLSRYDWIGVGYQFTLPKASAYRSLSFQVVGRWSGSTAPKIGINDWTVRGAFDGRTFGGGAFNFVRPRSSMGTSAAAWYTQYQTDMGRFVSGRTVRAFIDTGGYLSGPVRYTISRVRLVVSYGILY